MRIEVEAFSLIPFFNETCLKMPQKYRKKKKMALQFVRADLQMMIRQSFSP